MNRFIRGAIGGLACWFLAAGPSHSVAVPFLVGSAHQGLSVSSTLTATTTADCVGGSVLAILAADQAPPTQSAAVSSATDSNSNTYTALTQGTYLTMRSKIFYKKLPATLSSGGTVTVTYASSIASETMAAVCIPSGVTGPQDLGYLTLGSTTSFTLTWGPTLTNPLFLSLLSISSGAGITYTDTSSGTVLANVDDTMKLVVTYRYPAATTWTHTATYGTAKATLESASTFNQSACNGQITSTGAGC